MRKLLVTKIGALVRVSAHRIKVTMASGCPTAAAWDSLPSGLQGGPALRPPERAPRRTNHAASPSDPPGPTKIPAYRPKNRGPGVNVPVIRRISSLPHAPF